MLLGGERARGESSSGAEWMVERMSMEGVSWVFLYAPDAGVGEAFSMRMLMVVAGGVPSSKGEIWMVAVRTVDRDVGTSAEL